jgi:hypothetical protein
MSVSQDGQCDGGFTIDSFRGILQMQTLKKLPRMSPRTKNVDATKYSGRYSITELFP